jgi:hypothetical protein
MRGAGNVDLVNVELLSEKQFLRLGNPEAHVVDLGSEVSVFRVSSGGFVGRRLLSPLLMPIAAAGMAAGSLSVVLSNASTDGGQSR